MTEQSPMVVLVHGAFTGSASWNGVVARLADRSVDVVAVANPLRSLAGDAAYLRDVISGLDRRVILVGHAYGGSVITEAAARNDAVNGLVYVCAYAPAQGESAVELSGMYPGCTLAETLLAYPVDAHGNELLIRSEAFHQQFAADVSPALAALMAATQRPVTEAALNAGLPSAVPAWQTLPSWFAFGDEDRTIPIPVHRYMAQRAGANGTREVAGGSHALNVSDPDVVTASINDALTA